MIPQITIISGPTCCGKTRRAMEEALAENAEIISCDSVQVYRGMDIGSDKAPAEDRAKIPHHLIDVADVSEGFDIARYVELAKEALAGSNIALGAQTMHYEDKGAFTGEISAAMLKEYGVEYVVEFSGGLPDE